MSTKQSRLMDLSFPAELLLKIIQQIPFEANHLRELSLVHSRFGELIANYERSLTKSFACSQLPHAFADFPCGDSDVSFDWLSQCIRQYDIVDDVMAVLVSDLNCFAVERHNMALANTGLLLLYRLNSMDTYTKKMTFINTLPRDPLTAIFVAIQCSKLTARYHGQGIINQRTYGRFLDANHLELRNELEFCFSEGAMNLGPDFIHESLYHKDTSETTLMCLYHDHGIHDWDTNVPEGEFMPPITEGPERNPDSKPRTLYTTLLERMADLMESPLDEVVSRINEDVETADHSLAWLSLSSKARLIQGLDLDYADEA
ncbi:hypothetical protein K491DRAFT_497864 [Lophiostoma macrostomum CBS 122681]|uniref:Uncharacterized protein n=1 Tax=Lophiostoma macrostomum CBS 122681 TaxID=1314788 RepID=A0A6A6T1C0_9PLEO|nr:hypothetical protein K491DRAFT_497864 [Lophiostoma macrostomum CBS 122681]